MRIRVITISLAAAALLSLTACGSSGSTTAAPQAPVASSGAGTPAGKQPAPVVPSPNAAQQAGLLAGLKAINPALAADPATAVAGAQYVCAEIHAGKDDATVAKEAAAKFSGGAVTLNDAQGKVVASAVKASFCTMP
ncbi:hypothetical protein AB0D08_26975 [Kitasatospora sp. NPDC048540]|uniref:DUF732 domain-containing protein n=1 Tax=unclassified Kitasatospora TaxID=2633591 RepID=UPI0005396FF3|nr:hypothetical protein [Kitasatospora sp. MBT63]